MSTTVTAVTKNTRYHADYSSMQGMIWNANHLLQLVLESNVIDSPKALFSDKLKGILLVSCTDAALFFGTSAGSGILLAKTGEEGENKWSPPCAVGVSSTTFGCTLGYSNRDVIVFIYDDKTLDSMTIESGNNIGGVAQFTAGKYSYGTNFDEESSHKGGNIKAFSFTRGAFMSLGVDFGGVAPQWSVNEKFYGKDLTPKQILHSDDIIMPEKAESTTLIAEVYKKLGLLIEGNAAGAGGRAGAEEPKTPNRSSEGSAALGTRAPAAGSGAPNGSLEGGAGGGADEAPKNPPIESAPGAEDGGAGGGGAPAPNGSLAAGAGADGATPKGSAEAGAGTKEAVAGAPPPRESAATGASGAAAGAVAVGTLGQG